MSPGVPLRMAGAIVAMASLAVADARPELYNVRSPRRAQEPHDGGQEALEAAKAKRARKNAARLKQVGA